jgi:hypothetical protein
MTNKQAISDGQAHFLYVITYYFILISMATVFAPQIASIILIDKLFGTFGTVLILIAWNFVFLLLCSYADEYEQRFPQKNLRKKNYKTNT